MLTDKIANALDAFDFDAALHNARTDTMTDENNDDESSEEESGPPPKEIPGAIEISSEEED